MLCDSMDDEQLSKHIDQLEALLEDVKLRQQAANHVRNKRLKTALASGKLTEAQVAEMMQARSAKPSAKVRTVNNMTGMSKEEKEIQKLMKQGLSREKAVKLMEMD